MENLFEDFKVSCSQIGSLMGNAKGNKPATEAQIKKLLNILGRGYPQLSENMKNTARDIMQREIYYEPKRPPDKALSNLVQIYAYEMYGKGKISKGNDSPHQAEKGNIAEPASIKLLSDFDGIEYEKNEQMFSNKWFKGIPDVIVTGKNGKPEKIIEIKTSYDLPSFILSKYKQESPNNIYELWGYMDMLGCKKGEIVHCLVDMPEQIASFEEKILRERYTWLELDEETIAERIGRTLSNMEYDNVPKEAKIFRRSFEINKLAMKDAKWKATAAKGWLNSIHNMFIENIVILPETDSGNEEDGI